MSEKAAFLRLVGRAVREPWGDGWLSWVLATWGPVADALEDGDDDLARELVADVQGRALLRQALPSWKWSGD